ncbi:MAG: metallophosphoesterase [Rhodobacter sp.]|nr:metallophosphoesterase [Rhodobacter sp.]
MSQFPLSGLLQRLRALTGGATTSGHALLALPEDRPVYAIGDVHGCLGLLRDLLAAIQDDAALAGHGARIVLLGDMIDRGEDSAGVLELVMSLAAQGRVLPILGNHERMMLQFLDDPCRNAAWLEMGGFETLMSYGLALDQARLRALSRRRLMQTLEAHVPEPVRDWLRALPLGYHLRADTGTYVLAHAGLSGAHPLSAQPESALLWATQSSIPDRLVLVHGHFICNAPSVKGNRIEIDTGAWKTGRLTAVRLWRDQVPRFLTVKDARVLRPSRPGAINQPSEG